MGLNVWGKWNGYDVKMITSACPEFEDLLWNLRILSSWLFLSLKREKRSIIEVPKWSKFIPKVPCSNNKVWLNLKVTCVIKCKVMCDTYCWSISSSHKSCEDGLSCFEWHIVFSHLLKSVHVCVCTREREREKGQMNCN